MSWWLIYLCIFEVRGCFVVDLLFWTLMIEEILFASRSDFCVVLIFQNCFKISICFGSIFWNDIKSNSIWRGWMLWICAVYFSSNLRTCYVLINDYQVVVGVFRWYALISWLYSSLLLVSPKYDLTITCLQLVSSSLPDVL